MKVELEITNPQVADTLVAFLKAAEENYGASYGVMLGASNGKETGITATANLSDSAIGILCHRIFERWPRVWKQFSLFKQSHPLVAINGNGKN